MSSFFNPCLILSTKASTFCILMTKDSGWCLAQGPRPGYQPLRSVFLPFQRLPDTGICPSVCCSLPSISRFHSSWTEGLAWLPVVCPGSVVQHLELRIWELEPQVRMKDSHGCQGIVAAFLVLFVRLVQFFYYCVGVVRTAVQIVTGSLFP